MGKRIMAVLAAAGVFCGDQIAKKKIEEMLEPGEEQEILSGKIRLRRVYNKGIVMGILKDSPELVKWLPVMAVGMFLTVYLPVFFGKGKALAKISGGMLLGGAASNLYDRFEKEQVVDYIGFPLENPKAADITYNIGDFAIFLGALGSIFGAK